MLQITTKDSYLKITVENKDIGFYPKNTLSFQLNFNSEIVTLKQGKEIVVSELIDNITIDDERVSKDNFDEVIKQAFSASSNSSLGLERRIALVMENTEQIIPINEKMTLYKATGKNIAKAEIKPNDDSITKWVEINLNNNIDIDLSNCVDKDAILRITKQSIDNISTIYLYTKIIES